MNCETLCLSLKELFLVPSREKMLGMIRLRKKLFEMGVESGLIDRLTEF